MTIENEPTFQRPSSRLRSYPQRWPDTTSLLLALSLGFAVPCLVPDVPPAQTIRSVAASPAPIRRSVGAPTESAPTVAVSAAAPALTEMEALVAKAADNAGVDPRLLLAIAKKESQLDPAALSRRSSAQGLFQFTKITWIRMIHFYGEKHGLKSLADSVTIADDGRVSVSDRKARAEILKLRDDPKLSAAMAADLLLDNKERVERHLGRDLTDQELYLTHFLGTKESIRFLSAYDRHPNVDAVKVLPSAAESNSSIFFDEKRARTVRDVYDHLAEVITGYMTDYATVAPVEIAVVDPAPKS